MLLARYYSGENHMTFITHGIERKCYAVLKEIHHIGDLEEYGRKILGIMQDSTKYFIFAYKENILKKEWVV